MENNANQCLYMYVLAFYAFQSSFARAYRPGVYSINQSDSIAAVILLDIVSCRFLYKLCAEPLVLPTLRVHNS